MAEMVVLSLVMLVARGAFRSPLGNDDFKQVKLVLSKRRRCHGTLLLLVVVQREPPSVAVAGAVAVAVAVVIHKRRVSCPAFADGPRP